MKHYVFSRLLQLIPILFVITFLSFAMMRLAGSDVVLQSMERTGMAASDAVVAAARAELGLDKPFLTQYFTWLGKLLQGDMGRSYVSGRPVFETFIAKLPATLLLTGVSVGLTLLVSLPLGVFSAVNQNRFSHSTSPGWGSSSKATWDAATFRDAQSLRPSLQNFPQRFCLPGCLSVSRFSYHCRSEFFRRSIKTAGATG